MNEDPLVKKVQVPIGGMVEAIAPSILPRPAQVGDLNIAPKTTAEQDTMTAGQRRINLLWEWTQAVLAVIVTSVTLYIAARLALDKEHDQAAFLLLSNAFFSVISVYLTRTNHTKTGGVQAGDSGR